MKPDWFWPTVVYAPFLLFFIGAGIYMMLYAP
jgi:hypothetical protein